VSHRQRRNGKGYDIRSKPSDQKKLFFVTGRFAGLQFCGCSGRRPGVRFSRLASHLPAFEFLRQFTLEAPLFAGFQKKRVLLGVLKNALLLNLSLETPKGALHGFAVVNSHLCQNSLPYIDRLFFNSHQLCNETAHNLGRNP
jgi:hypothetical protein